MRILEQSLLSVTKGVIIHQVNCQHVMGAGIALAIRKMYPQHYQDYMNSKLYLGAVVTTKIAKDFGIIGMCSQDRYGRDKRYTDYEAFVTCLKVIANLKAKAPAVAYYMPVGIGCNNAGGDWNVVSALIEEFAPFIILCSYK